MARLLAILIFVAAMPMAASANPVVQVRVLSEHSVQIEGKRYDDPKSLTPKISEINHRKPKPDFSIVAPPGTDFKTLGGVISLLQKAGVERLGVLIEPSSK